MIGDKLKKSREDKGLGINELSRIADVNASYISAIERNEKKNPSIQILNKLAVALEVPINEFFKSEPMSEEKLKKWDDKYNRDGVLFKEVEIAATLDIIPEEFTVPEEARAYIGKHRIFSSEGFNLNKLSDKEVLEFANALLEQMRMVGYKYKK